MIVIGPFTLHEHLTDNPRYELFFDWDESFDDRGLTITKITETNGDPGDSFVMGINRKEAQVLFDYLYGCLNFRPRPQ